MRNVLLIATLLLALPGLAAEREVIRDANGRRKATVVTNGTQTTYRDAKGRVSVTARQQGSVTRYYDSNGRILGRTSENGRNTTYRDAKGRPQLQRYRASKPFTAIPADEEWAAPCKTEI